MLINCLDSFPFPPSIFSSVSFFTNLYCLPFLTPEIGLPQQSENPILDELWSAVEKDWAEVKEGETAILAELQTENLAGCLQFIGVREIFIT